MSEVATVREVIPFRERKLDIALWCFFLLNVVVVTYTADVEQLLIANPDSFDYPIWPPPFVVDLLHDYFRDYDPLIYARPDWYRAIVAIDSFFYGPFYMAALYAFWTGREWIRNLCIIWGAVMLATVTIILVEEAVGPYATDHLPLVLATNVGWLLVPIVVLVRMWREHPFTRVIPAMAES